VPPPPLSSKAFGFSSYFSLFCVKSFLRRNAAKSVSCQRLHRASSGADQPEDDLDNRFVYEDVVQILREQKGLKDQRKRRQIIAATHNANIPVLGDAELVLALETRDGRAHIVGCASIDDSATWELVKTIMEGGEEAFQRRAEKYGGLRARS
jgi:hypothetical protein